MASPSTPSFAATVRKSLLTAFQVGVTLFALYWVFRKPADRASMLADLRAADPRWLLLSLVASAFSPLSAAYRWGLLLRVQGIWLSWKRVAQLYMIGSFFNLFLLGSTGGDAVKLVYLLRQVEPKKRAGGVMAVGIDRVIGLMALIILATVFVILRYHWLTQTPAAAGLLATFALIIGSGALGIVAAAAVVGLRLADKLPAAMPGRTKILEGAAAVQAYARSWPTVIRCVFISMGGHASFFCTYYCAARGLHAVISFWDMAVILPIVNTIIALPISVSGVGVRENLYVHLLGDLCGISKPLATSISIVGFLSSVIFYGLLGGVFYLFYRAEDGVQPLPAHPDEIEVQVLEDTIMHPTDADASAQMDGQYQAPEPSTEH
jgi:uncharacterized membrane protein YbhN (UPF0104 family)